MIKSNLTWTRAPIRVFLATLLLCGLGGHASEPPETQAPDTRSGGRKQVLIVTGEDHGAHRWQETTPLLRTLLAQDDRLDVSIVEDLGFLRSPEIHHQAAIVMHFKNYDPKIPGRAGYENLTKFVERGGGLVIVHFASGAFQEFKDDFVKTAGRVWDPKRRGHDPYGKFTVNIVNNDHPVTQGLDDFETADELYTCLDGETPIQILADAESKVDRQRYPMALVLKRGSGRVFHTPLGHDVSALSNSGTAELIRRGTAWVAGLEPARRQ